MRLGTVCSGIGAPEVALRPLGFDLRWTCEIEPFPSAVLAHHYPGVPNLGDLTTLPERAARGEIEPIDVLIGGTPCQSFSVAGLRKGLLDPRGNLTLAFVELANELDPEWILWENVPGVLSDKTNAFGAFLGGLVGADTPLLPGGRGKWAGAGVAVGPARIAAWRILDAQYFGVAQRRRRVFVLAHRGARDWSAADALLPLVQGLRGDPPPRRAAKADVAGTLGAGSARGGWDPGQFDRNGALIPEVAHTLRAEGFDAGEDGTGRGVPLVPEVAHCICGGPDGRQFGTGRDGQDTFIPIPFDTTQITSPLNRSAPAPGDPSHPLAAGAHPPAIAFSAKDYGADAGDLAPTLRAGGFTSSHANGGVMPAVAFHVTQDPISGEVAPALGCGNKQGCGTLGVATGIDLYNHAITGEVAATLSTNSGTGTGTGTGPSLMHGMAVRRLTPRECERLQGFPDDYTAIPGAKDGPRYRALGNSMAVPVMRWIGRRIQMVDEACAASEAA